MTEHDTEALAVFDNGSYSCACPGDWCESIPCDNDRSDLTTTVAALIAKAKAEGAAEALPRVIRDLLTEREHQVSIGYTPENDDRYTTDEFVRWSATYARRCGKSGEPGYYDRARLIQAAALLVAAVESMDRRDRAAGIEASDV